MLHLPQCRLMLWSLAVLAVNPLPARAQTSDGDDASGVSLEIDLLAPSEPSKDICYDRPENWHPKLESKFRQVFEGAASATRPGHVDAFLRFVDVDQPTGCRHRLFAVLEPGAKGEPRNLTVRLVEDGETKHEGVAGPLVPFRSTVGQLKPLWSELWAAIAPAPPPPDPPEAEDETFVDEDLLEARESFAERERSGPSGPFVTAILLAGATLRGVDVDPAIGREQDLGALASLGGRADLHVGSLLGWTGHRLDARFGYWRQLASAEIDGRSVGTQADRVRGHLEYGRRWFGSAGPELAAVAGVEYRRFVFDDAADTVSSELTAIRPGLDLEQTLFGRGAPLTLALQGGGRARIPVGSDRFDVGFDAHAGLVLRHAIGFVAELMGEYTRQTGDLGSAAYAEDLFDLSVGVGWSF